MELKYPQQGQKWGCNVTFSNQATLCSVMGFAQWKSPHFETRLPNGSSKYIGALSQLASKALYKISKHIGVPLFNL